MRPVWILIFILTGIGLLGAGNRIWNIRFLYLRPEVRSNLVTIMRAANDSKGWSASDLNLQKINCESEKKCVFRFDYHYRGSQLNSENKIVEVLVENGQVNLGNL